MFKVLEIENPELRAKLKEASWGQSQVTDASQLWVFCSYQSHNPADVIAFSTRKAKVQSLPSENAQKYAEFVNQSLSNQPVEAFQNWTEKQTYIALGGLMIACAELGIDSCPMEGFSADQYDEILGLSAQNLKAAVVVTMGYRSDEDTTAALPKVRKELSDLFVAV
jgi:nitroreductase/dihydropteridine reductase